jgi:GNAT superfamily N-acetyltransferase
MPGRYSLDDLVLIRVQPVNISIYTCYKFYFLFFLKKIAISWWRIRRLETTTWVEVLWAFHGQGGVSTQKIGKSLMEVLIETKTNRFLKLCRNWRCEKKRSNNFNAPSGKNSNWFIRYLQGRMLIELVAIHPAYWRRGHGKTLLNWGLALAEKDGVNTGVIANTTAVGLYLSLGLWKLEKLPWKTRKNRLTKWTVSSWRTVHPRLLREEHCSVKDKRLEMN